MIAISHLVEWPVGKWAWFIQSFNIGQYIFTAFAAGQLYQRLNPTGEFNIWQGSLAIIISLMFFVLLNALLVGTVILLTRGFGFKQSGVFNFLPLILDFTLLGMGAVATILWNVQPLLVVLLLASLYVIYSVLRVPALERESKLDPKTGVYNAKYLVTSLEEELARANRYQRPLTIVMADLDFLRNVNNIYGHLAGDIVLKGIAEILTQNVREYDVVARFGGEEFAILFPETKPEDAFRRVDQIRQKIADTEFGVSTIPAPIKVTMSFGVAGRLDDEITKNQLIHNADVALFMAKRAGRNTVRLFSQEYSSLISDEPYPDLLDLPPNLEERIRLHEVDENEPKVL
ncbi:MAG: GGDEF domain-containing protein [Anaerolineales bacterium]